MYYLGFENGKNLDVLVFVVLFWIWEWSTCWCSCIWCIIWESRMDDMLIFHHVMYDRWFESGQFVDVLVFVVAFGIREWPTCWCFGLMYYFGFENGQHVDVLVFVVFCWIREWSTWRCFSICCISLESRMNNMLIFYICL